MADRRLSKKGRRGKAAPSDIAKTRPAALVGVARRVRALAYCAIHAFSMCLGRVPGASRITSTRMSSPGPA